jgi:ABC-type uncharacterized transport system substrate-binding protein
MKILKMLMVFSMLFVFMASVPLLAADKGVFSTAPKTNDGKKWRVGYYEGGEYIDYQTVLIATIKALMEMGWIERAAIPPQKGEQTAVVWKWLATKAKSKYIEFVADAHYSAGWDEKQRVKTVEAIIKRLNAKKDIDLMMSLGTWAGKDLANNRHHTPVVVMSTSNALKSNIIKSVEDSGYDHVHARVDPYRYERQLRVFHDIINFRKLGVAYENTVEGRSYAAIDKIEKVAKERNFEIVRDFTKSDVADAKMAAESVIKAFSKLATESDAIYVTVQGGVNKRSIPDLVRIVTDHHIPTFSQSGSHEVKYGFLMSLSQAGYKYFGQFNSKTIAKIFNGAKPRQLNQLFEAPPKIAINLKSAVAIGFDPPVDVLGAADEIYEEIAVPN